MVLPYDAPLGFRCYHEEDWWQNIGGNHWVKVGCSIRNSSVSQAKDLLTSLPSLVDAGSALVGLSIHEGREFVGGLSA